MPYLMKGKALVEDNPTFNDLTLTGDLVPATPLSHRNLIINGAFQVAQRGTSLAGGGFIVDRFELNINNTDEIVITQSQDAQSPDGFSNSWKIIATTDETTIAVDERVRFRQNIEAQNLQQLAFGSSSAKSVTLSFWVRSNVTGTYAVNLEQDDASRVIGGTYAISSANTWEQKSITFAGDTGGTINDDNGTGLVVSWYLLAGGNYKGTTNTSWGASADGKQANGHTADWGEDDNDDFYITGVQLELGSNATPFEHRSYGEELARCQRYFEIGGGDWSGRYWSASGSEGNFSFLVDKRATPVISKHIDPVLHNQGTGSVTFSTVSPSVYNGFSSAFIEITGGASGTTGNHLWAKNNFAKIDAEL